MGTDEWLVFICQMWRISTIQTYCRKGIVNIMQSQKKYGSFFISTFYLQSFSSFHARWLLLHKSHLLTKLALPWFVGKHLKNRQCSSFLSSHNRFLSVNWLKLFSFKLFIYEYIRATWELTAMLKSMYHNDFQETCNCYFLFYRCYIITTVPYQLEGWLAYMKFWACHSKDGCHRRPNQL